MKVGVSSYSFHRYLVEGKLDIFGVIRMAAEIGFEGIEFSGFYGKESEDQKALAVQIKDACAKAGLPVVSYTIGADFLNPLNGGKTWQDEVERLKGEVDIAAVLGVPVMRHDASRGFDEKRINLADFLEALPILEQGCREVTKYAADKGVKTMVENHGFCVQDSERCELLVNTVNHPNFGSLVDLGNFLCADDDPLRAVTRMSKYAFHVHAKDFHVKCACADPGAGWFRSRGGNWLRGSIIGHGNVDVPGCVKAVVASGYKGFCSIEFEGMEDNKTALEIGLANLKRYIAAAQ